MLNEYINRLKWLPALLRGDLLTQLTDCKVARERYQTLADSVQLIVWTADVHGEINFVNRAWTDYTGLNLSQTQNAGWLRVVHPDEVASCWEGWMYAVDMVIPYEAKCRIRRAADGAYRWHLIRAIPRRDGDSVLMEFVGTSLDVDDITRQAENEHTFMARVLAACTSGKVHFCHTPCDLPVAISDHPKEVILTQGGGEGLSQVRSVIRNICDEYGYGDQARTNALTCAGEVGENALMFAGSGVVHICATSTSMQIWVRDKGKGIPTIDLPRAILEYGFGEGEGHGYTLVLSMADSIHISTSPMGTTVVITIGNRRV